MSSRKEGKSSSYRFALIPQYLDASIGNNPIPSKNAATSTVQQHSPITPKQPRSHNRTLIPIYVLPEHLCQVQQFVLSLGQPIVLCPTMDAYFQHKSSNADYFSDVSCSYESSDPLDLISAFSSLSTSTSSDYVQLTPSASTTFVATSAQDLPIPSISHIPLHSSASPTKQSNRYYSILIGKKTGVFWDEW